MITLPFLTRDVLVMLQGSKQKELLKYSSTMLGVCHVCGQLPQIHPHYFQQAGALFR
jgi:hypothetical protein